MLWRCKMVLFGVETANTERATEFFSEVNERLHGEDLVKNPFDGWTKYYRDFHIISINPLYPPIYWFGFIPLLFAFVFGGWVRWLLLGGAGFLFFTSFFYSRYLFYFLMVRGIRKAGYRGSIRLMKDQETINRVVKWE